MNHYSNACAQGEHQDFYRSRGEEILVSSLTGFHTFKNEYPEFKVNFEVVHITQYLFQLIQEGRLELTKEYGKKVTYHDRVTWAGIMASMTSPERS